MGLSPIVFIIYIVTIGTLLNFKDDNNGHGIQKKTLRVNRPLLFSRHILSYTIYNDS